MKKRVHMLRNIIIFALFTSCAAPLQAAEKHSPEQSTWSTTKQVIKEKVVPAIVWTASTTKKILRWAALTAYHYGKQLHDHFSNTPPSPVDPIAQQIANDRSLAMKIASEELANQKIQKDKKITVAVSKPPQSTILATKEAETENTMNDNAIARTLQQAEDEKTRRLAEEEAATAALLLEQQKHATKAAEEATASEAYALELQREEKDKADQELAQRLADEEMARSLDGTGSGASAGAGAGGGAGGGADVMGFDMPAPMLAGNMNDVQPLLNIGNACFLNTALQCLLASPSNQEYLSTLFKTEDYTTAIEASPFVKELKQFVTNYWENKPLDPRSLVSEWRKLLKQDSTAQTRYGTGDASEAYRALMQELGKINTPPACQFFSTTPRKNMTAQEIVDEALRGTESFTATAEQTLMLQVNRDARYRITPNDVVTLLGIPYQLVAVGYNTGYHWFAQRQTNAGSWVRCDDAILTSITLKDVQKPSPDACILFYEKIDVQD